MKEECVMREREVSREMEEREGGEGVRREKDVKRGTEKSKETEER